MLLWATWSVVSASVATAAEVRVAVAANFAGPAAQLAEAFHAASGHTVQISAGSTGKFYAQIRAGAPFEVLLSADEETPQKLIDEQLAVPGSAFTYAVGQLVLWSARAGVVDGDGRVLASGGFTHLALANPKLAPYGAAAIEVLKARGVLEALTPKLVQAESIAQAYQFVYTGNAELGFVALSQVAAPGQAASGSYWRVPASLYRPIRQDAVLLQAGAASSAARDWLAYLRSAPARAIIAAYGYGQ
ncbi:molybdate ABC transporter substrate-binding protein [Ideonella sp. DXS29W]|uniref:Molybdate ABC transporter substrate-binding protein n=1 Tax=Ideonella lacteola TaxID=2984193 RepID=A0ABU9BX36_9BURK